MASCYGVVRSMTLLVPFILILMLFIKDLVQDALGMARLTLTPPKFLSWALPHHGASSGLQVSLPWQQTAGTGLCSRSPGERFCPTARLHALFIHREAM